MKGKTKTTKRVTSKGTVLPKGVYLSNNKADATTFVARPHIKGIRVYLGSFKSVNKAKKAIKDYGK